jgi:hypothetical protein
VRLGEWAERVMGSCGHSRPSGGSDVWAGLLACYVQIGLRSVNVCSRSCLAQLLLVEKAAYLISW